MTIFRLSVLTVLFAVPSSLYAGDPCRTTFYPCVPVIECPPPLCCCCPVIRCSIPTLSVQESSRPAPKTRARITRPAPRTQKPKVKESRSAFFRSTTTRKQTSKSAQKDRCQVGFWNLTTRDLLMKVNNHSFVLRRGQTVTFQLPREILWQYDNGDLHTVYVPENRRSHEVVIRR